MSTTNAPITTINPVSILISLFSILVSIYICRKNVFTPLKIESTRKQLEYVYTPLFVFIEPYLYKTPSMLVINEFITMFEKIKLQHYELVNTNLIMHFDTLKKSIKNNSYSTSSYENLCIHLDCEFEKLRRSLSYPTRDFWYKKRYTQFDSDKRVVLKQISDFVGISLTIFFYSFLIGIGIYLISLIITFFSSLFR